MVRALLVQSRFEFGVQDTNRVQTVAQMLHAMTDEFVCDDRRELIDRPLDGVPANDHQKYLFAIVALHVAEKVGQERSQRQAVRAVGSDISGKIDQDNFAGFLQAIEATLADRRLGGKPVERDD